MVDQILKHKDEIIELCKMYRVEAISLFGSAANNTMHEASDVDFLVQFSDQIQVLDYADNYFSFKEALSNLLGHTIDLLSIDALHNPVLKEEIFRSKIDLYAA